MGGEGGICSPGCEISKQMMLSQHNGSIVLLCLFFAIYLIQAAYKNV